MFKYIFAFLLISSTSFADGSSTEKQFADNAITKVSNYFKSNGMITPDPVIYFRDKIEVYSEEGTVIATANGSHEAGRIYIVKRDKMNDKPFGLDMTDELYQNIIEHELVHFYYTHNFKGSTDTVIGQELWAYSLQIEFLSEETRNKILDKYPAMPFNIMQYGGMLLMTNTWAFAVEAYRNSNWRELIRLGTLIPENKFGE